VSTRRILLTVLYLATVTVFAWSAWRGRDYYALPLIERPRHPLHWELKPGGTAGIRYGATGAGLMTAMLGYSVRKRLPMLRRTGSLRGWLDFHIWCGVTGPALILLHSALKIGGLIAISFWSMVAVALSGILGRFLYAQIPRTAAGDELSLEGARGLEAELSARIAREHDLDESDVTLFTIDSVTDRSRSVVLLSASLLLAPAILLLRARRFRRAHPEIPRRAARRLVALARQRALLRRRLALWKRLHELFHYWHVFHKPFAILMYLFAAVHIGVAWATGYARLAL